MENKRKGKARPDLLRRDRQTDTGSLSGLGNSLPRENDINLYQMKELLKSETSIPEDVIHAVVRQLQSSMPALGLDHPSSQLIIQWLTGLLAQRGYTLDELPFQSLELSLENVEMNMLSNRGTRTGVEHAKTPEATSLIIAQHIKAQVALKNKFQPKVVEAHREGLLDLTHLGSVDRPHDIFLTPEYIKMYGLPAYSRAPQAGPAVSPDVLLSHLVRFTHELQNHFAGEVHWGFFNTLILPFLKGRKTQTYRQFAQQLLFEFAQLDVGRGGLSRKVILEMDVDIPLYLESVDCVGPGGKKTGDTYGSLSAELQKLNHAVLDVLERGDYRGCPFYAPHIVFHFNRSNVKWTAFAQQLFKQAFRTGNPSIAFSQDRRYFGPMGVVPVHDTDWIKYLQKPEDFRGFSLSTLTLNLPRMFYEGADGQFEQKLEEALHVALSAHREKRIFISNLMAKGPRGPHQFLRHKAHKKPFLKLDQGTLITTLVGLAEASALCIGSDKPHSQAVIRTADRILSSIRAKIDELGKLHKLNMQIAIPSSEEVACRLAKLDFQKFGSKFSSYMVRDSRHTEPFYSTGSNILFDKKMAWEERLTRELSLHKHFNGSVNHVVYARQNDFDDPGIYHSFFVQMREIGHGHLQPAPDMSYCLSCGFIFSPGLGTSCPHCHKTQLSDFGLGQSAFSPVQYWCRGKKTEWDLRHRFDEDNQPTQEVLPFFT
ncbi:MAG: hypothetical protein CR997_12140 [Acidobacteria bacterium]|nr:MAG: hypothetical protein CR997_12140 [Acidobacteriota bacterium]